MPLKMVIAVVVALVVGLVLGFIAGRTSLERKWSQPYAVVSPADVKKNADGDPAPKAGTKVLTAMPIKKARLALASLIEKDPAVVTVAAVGADEEGLELHAVVENRGTCTLNSVEGVAYGYEPRGRPTKTNKSGAKYVAFASDVSIEPGKKGTITQKLRYADDATLAIAHVDHTTCADGSSWARP